MIAGGAPRRVRLLYFAALRDLAGCAEEDRELPADVACVADVPRWLSGAVPALDGRLASVRIAVNEEFADADTPVSAGDVIALIPPVSGG